MTDFSDLVRRIAAAADKPTAPQTAAEWEAQKRAEQAGHLQQQVLNCKSRIDTENEQNGTFRGYPSWVANYLTRNENIA